MNRGMRRQVNKKHKKKLTKEEFDIVENLLESRKLLKMSQKLEQELKSGDKVKLNISNIMEQKIGHEQRYLDFIDENKEKIFTIKENHKGLCSLVEEEFYLFNDFELTKVVILGAKKT